MMLHLVINRGIQNVNSKILVPVVTFELHLPFGIWTGYSQQGQHLTRYSFSPILPGGYSLSKMVRKITYGLMFITQLVLYARCHTTVHLHYNRTTIINQNKKQNENTVKSYKRLRKAGK